MEVVAGTDWRAGAALCPLSVHSCAQFQVRAATGNTALTCALSHVSVHNIGPGTMVICVHTHTWSPL